MRNNSLLQIDDFQVGMFVTVWDIKKDTSKDEEEFNPIMMMMQQGGNMHNFPHLEALKGAVLKIEAINLPFLMVSIFETNCLPPASPKFHPAPLDVRELHFMKLNKEYVNAYLGKSHLKLLLQDKKFSDIQNIKGTDPLDSLIKQEDTDENT